MSEDLTLVRCPRCGAAFGCGAAGAAPCACSRVRLTEALKAQLRESYRGCLCIACLKALGAEPADEAGTAAAKDAAAGR